MIKVVVMVRRRPGLTREQFKAYWLDHHAVLEREIFPTSHMRRIVANFVEADMVSEPAFDGYAELYFDSHADMQAQFATSTDDRMKADEANFCDPVSRVIVLVEGVVICER